MVSRYTGGGAIDQAAAAEIRAERARRGWTQEQLAERSGLHVKTIYRLESGQVSVTLTHLIALGEAFGIDPGALMERALAEYRKVSDRVGPDALGGADDPGDGR